MQDWGDFRNVWDGVVLSMVGQEPDIVRAR